MKTVADFLFLGSKITADVNCSQEIKRRLLLGGIKIKYIHTYIYIYIYTYIYIYMYIIEI